MNYLQYTAPLISAGLLFLSFVPEWGFLPAHAALVPLLVSIRRGRAGLFSIWIFGTAFAAMFFLWLKVFSPLAPILMTIVHGLWTVLALWPAILFCRRKQEGLGLMLVPVCWVAMEWLRSLGPYGYEWGVIGYTQYGTLTIAAFAHSGGIWLVSFLVLVSNVLLTWAWLQPDRRWLAAPLIYAIALIGLSPAACLSDNVEAARDFALIQTNISPYPPPLDRDRAIREQLDALAVESLRAKPKNLIFPETLFSTEITGMRGNLLEDPRDALAGFLDPYRRNLLLVGAIEKDDRGFYNAAILFDATGRRIASYRKQHLVPFGETIPGLDGFGWARAFGEKLGTPFFSAGDTCAPLSFGDTRAAILICFEGTFSRLVAESARGAHLIINISNDAWSESPFGHALHLRFLRFRAIETGLPVIRVGNSGPTALFAPNGRLTLDIPHANPAVLDLSAVAEE